MPITRVPIRLEILRAITAALKTINPENGYEFDLRDEITPDNEPRERVVRGRLHIGDDEPLPMVSLLEPPMVPQPIDTKKQQDNTTRAGDWDIIIQGWVRDDGQNPTDSAYQLEAEVRRRLASEKKRPDARPGNPNGMNYFGLGRKIMNMSIGSPVIRPNEHISEQAVFYLVLTLQISEDMATPLG